MTGGGMRGDLFKNRKGWEKFRMPEAPPGVASWTPKLVQERLLEALRLCGRTAGGVLPSKVKSSMPEFSLDWVDLSANAPDEAPKNRRPATAGDITRMEAAIAWQARYLGDHAIPRQVLAAYLRCKLYKASFEDLCQRMRWSRATAYRCRDRALAIIAMGLTMDGVPVDARPGREPEKTSGAPRRPTIETTTEADLAPSRKERRGR